MTTGNNYAFEAEGGEGGSAVPNASIQPSAPGMNVLPSYESVTPPQQQQQVVYQPVQQQQQQQPRIVYVQASPQQMQQQQQQQQPRIIYVQAPAQQQPMQMQAQPVSSQPPGTSATKAPARLKLRQASANSPANNNNTNAGASASAGQPLPGTVVKNKRGVSIVAGIVANLLVMIGFAVNELTVFCSTTTDICYCCKLGSSGQCGNTESDVTYDEMCAAAAESAACKISIEAAFICIFSVLGVLAGLVAMYYSNSCKPVRIPLGCGRQNVPKRFYALALLSSVLALCLIIFGVCGVTGIDNTSTLGATAILDIIACILFAIAAGFAKPMGVA